MEEIIQKLIAVDNTLSKIKVSGRHDADAYLGCLITLEDEIIPILSTLCDKEETANG